MKFYHYTSPDKSVDVVVVTDGIGDPQRQTILSVRGLYDATTRELKPAPVQYGLTPSSLRPTTIHTAHLVKLAIQANLSLEVRENSAPSVSLFAAVGNPTIPDGSVTGTADGDNDDNSGAPVNSDLLKGTEGLGDEEGKHPAAVLA